MYGSAWPMTIVIGIIVRAEKPKSAICLVRARLGYNLGPSVNRHACSKLGPPVNGMLPIILVQP